MSSLVLLIDDSNKSVVTDNTKPFFRFYVESEKNDIKITSTNFSLSNGYKKSDFNELGFEYDGKPLEKRTSYTATLDVLLSDGEKISSSLNFETGKLNEPWIGKWISDPLYSFKEKKISPKPLTFRKKFSIDKEIKDAKLYLTALGIYEIDLNGKKVGNRFLAPGYTSYENTLLYQTYDIKEQLKKDNLLLIYVGGGWAVGSFVMTRANRIYAKKQAILGEIHITYVDGEEEIVPTDSSFEVTTDSPYKDIDIYDGEEFDATWKEENASFHQAGLEKIRISPAIIADDGASVINHEKLDGKYLHTLKDGTHVYDFGQNFAGVAHLKLKNAKEGEKVLITHAELLKDDGSLNRELLRSAKERAVLITKEGEQEYEPRMSIFGFRYMGIKGLKKEDIEICAYARYSDIETSGSFSCSNEKINRLQQNILWSAKSNFVDIPTDCPQRDERMGWTGDIALFSPTACWNFNISRFLKKWLRDLRSEQNKGGGIGNTVPHKGYTFPITMPAMAIAFWGDASTLVPFALYDHYGDKKIIEESYDSMKRYCLAEKFWANLYGKHYIFRLPGMFAFGDWVAPDEPKMSGWQARNDVTGTASLKNMSMLVAKAADILGKEEDKKKFEEISKKTSSAFVKAFFDKDGNFKKKEYQTAFVLPLYYNMFPESLKEKEGDTLANLVKKNDYKVLTGFPGTPYLLFALADNNHLAEAYNVLLNEKCPSWLFEVKKGATTIWERFDAMKDDGEEGNLGQNDGTHGMVSFNHYASGSVGDFLYRRVLGIEAIEPGYHRFLFRPHLGGNLTNAEGKTLTPYGQIEAKWSIEEGRIKMNIKVPLSTICELVSPKGEKILLSQGKHEFVFDL